MGLRRVEVQKTDAVDTDGAAIDPVMIPLKDGAGPTR